MDTPNSWKSYVGNRNTEELIAAINRDCDPQGAFQGLLLDALSNEEYELAKRIDEMLSGYPNVEFESPLFGAIEDLGDVPRVIEWLLQQGHRLDVRGENDWTPLHMACRRNCVGIVRKLVEHGADVNAETRVDGGWTPIMEASSAGNKEIVEFLLARGADPRPAKAAASQAGHRELAEFLAQAISKMGGPMAPNKAELPHKVWRSRKKRRRR